MGNIRVDIEGHPSMEFPEGTDPQVIDMVVQRDVFKRSAQTATPQEPEQQVPQESGFAENVWNKWQERAKNIENIPQEMSGTPPALQGPRTLLRLGGEIGEGAWDLITEGTKSAYKTFTSPEQREQLSADVQGMLAQKPGKRDIKTDVASMYAGVEGLYPGAEKDVGAAVNLALLSPGKVASKVAGETTGKVMGKTATKLEKSVAEQVKRETIELIKPDIKTMTARQKQDALRQGQITKRGFMKGAEVNPSPKDIEIANTVEGIVDAKKNPIENIERLRTKIAELGDETFNMPFKSDINIDATKLRDYFKQAKEESSVIFATDKTLESAYDSIANEYTRILNKQPSKTLESVLAARREFDQLMRDKFPNIFNKFSGDNVRANAIKDVRMAANDYVADSLPEGHKFKKLLLDQSNMYRAIERISQKYSAVLDDSKFARLTRVIRAHPWLSVEAAAAIGGAGVMSMGTGGAIVKALTNPVIMGGLALYGTVRVGHMIYTSRDIKAGLADILKKGERVLAPTEKAEVKNIIDSLQASDEAKTVFINPELERKGYAEMERATRIKRGMEGGQGTPYNLRGFGRETPEYPAGLGMMERTTPTQPVADAGGMLAGEGAPLYPRDWREQLAEKLIRIENQGQGSLYGDYLGELPPYKRKSWR